MPAALLEGHADRVELARVPAGRYAEDETAARNDVEAAQRLRGDDGVPQGEHEHAGAELDPARAGGDGRRAW